MPGFGFLRGALLGPGKSLTAWLDPYAVAGAGGGAVAGADVPIAEIAFTTRAAFLMRADQASVAAPFFDTLRPDVPARVREVMLGAPQAGLLADGAWMAPLSGGRELVAVHASGASGFVRQDNPAKSGTSWPMKRVQLRGGEPRRIAVLDRSFRETAPGRFTGAVMLPAAGAGWGELVLTTGLGGQTLCFDVPTRIEAPAAAKGTGPARWSGWTALRRAPIRCG